MATDSADGSAQPELFGGNPRPAEVQPLFTSSKSPEEYATQWDVLWKDGKTPWDRGGPSMALNDLLLEFPEVFSPPFEGKRALVPGAGRGHDVLLLASFGFDAYGLDHSATSSKASRENEEKNKGLDVYSTKGTKQGKVTWLTGDYFSYDFSDIGPFDLIFDYTFLCAIYFEMRPKWSKAMKRNLAPTGKLVCLEFPTRKSTSVQSTPLALPSIVYESLLARPGERIPYGKEHAVDVKNLGPESPDRLVRLKHFTPKRTHKVGYDEESNVTDRISVWSHNNS
ncbi:hypothetical protein MKZ38_004002 [Zalerion maritima]|uniref:Thiol methyltransferase 1 n=1 Tax=Zalerion maritima TaxID=339359 RepID=A0AAD5WQ88_9PEZI|nr:hypothetical protein MKZ38_004002 [Zalerion maritima]